MESAWSYIDQALVGGILSGVLLLVAVSWLMFAQNWLWRLHLRSLSGPEFQALSAAHGLAVHSAGFRAQIGLSGSVEGQEIALTLRGGTRGVQVHLEHQRGASKRVVVTPWGSLTAGLDTWLLEELCSSEE